MFDFATIQLRALLFYFLGNEDYLRRSLAEFGTGKSLGVFEVTESPKIF